MEVNKQMLKKLLYTGVLATTLMGTVSIADIENDHGQNRLPQFQAVNQSFPDLGIDLKKYRESKSDSEFLPSEEAFEPEIWRDNQYFYAAFNIKDGYYLYKDKFSIGSSDSHYHFSPFISKGSVVKDDPFFGKVDIFHDVIVIKSEIESDAPFSSDRLVPVTFKYQGCAEAGLCYPVETIEKDLIGGESPPEWADYEYDMIQGVSLEDESHANDITATIDHENDANVIDNNGDTKDEAVADTEELNGNGNAMMMITLLLAGLALTFTPCVLPMLPILSAVIAGKRSTKSRFIRSGAYVAGMVVAYTIMGMLIGLFGAELNIQSKLQSPVVLGTIAILFLVLALYLMGWVNIPSGKLNNSITKMQDKVGQGSNLAVFATGFLSVLVVSPCISAPLAGVMLYISTTGDVISGGLGLMSLAIGMGIPLMAIAILGNSIMPKAGQWMEAVKNIFAALLMGMALWLVYYLLPEMLVMVIASAIVSFVAITILSLKSLDEMKQKTINILGYGVAIYAICLLLGAMGGSTNPIQPLKVFAGTAQSQAIEQKADIEWQTTGSPEELTKFLASASGNKTVLYFGADWCVSCRMLESEVFSDPDVVESVEGYSMIKMDVTADRKSVKEVMSKFGVFGPPTMIVYDESGQEVNRIIGELDAEEFMEKLKTS